MNFEFDRHFDIIVYLVYQRSYSAVNKFIGRI